MKHFFLPLARKVFPLLLTLAAGLFFACGSVSTGGGSTSGSQGSGDSVVPGTNYNATGMIPCSMGGGGSTGNCDFGVVRRGNGSADVHVTKPDGRKRVIFFEKGRAIGADVSQADPGEFRASKESDLYIIHIGNERYEIPEAVINGG
jgi:hypothetical protein